jgi:6-phospho-beta-glucosidase
VEVPATVGASGVEPIGQPPLPATTRGLIEALGAYQALTAEAGWSGGRRDAVAALTSHPLVGSLSLAEAIYDEMAEAHRAHLPDRLLR